MIQVEEKKESALYDDAQAMPLPAGVFRAEGQYHCKSACHIYHIQAGVNEENPLEPGTLFESRYRRRVGGEAGFLSPGESCAEDCDQQIDRSPCDELNPHALPERILFEEGQPGDKAGKRPKAQAACEVLLKFPDIHAVDFMQACFQNLSNMELAVKLPCSPWRINETSLDLDTSTSFDRLHSGNYGGCRRYAINPAAYTSPGN